MDPEVLIIGAGVIGLSIARELYRRGVRGITIVDRGTAGKEASWAAAGMLAPNIEADADNDFHAFALQSLAMYPDFAAQLFEETAVDIALDRTGTLFLAFNESEAEELDQTYRTQTARGVRVERFSAAKIRKIEPAISDMAVEGLYYPDDWQVDNRKLIVALRRFADLHKIRVVENAEAVRLLTSNGYVIGAETTMGALRSRVTVIATGAWTSLIKIGDEKIPVQVKPIRGQMICFNTDYRRLRHVVYCLRGYLVPRADGRLLVGATVEDVGFENALTEEGLASLVTAAVEVLPELSSLPVAEHWSGLRPFALDGFPRIGEIPGYRNAFVATAHYRNGILLAPRTATLLADAIVNGANSRYLELYGIGRFGESSVVRSNG